MGSTDTHCDVDTIAWHPQATLAACNVAARLSGYPVWTHADVLPFVDGPFAEIPKASPSIVNAKPLGLPACP